MTLPEFLSEDEGGFIHLSGHRLGLHHVVYLYNEGHSAEMLAAHYPSLPLSVAHKVIAFYIENSAEVDAYVARHDKEMERQISAANPPPSVAELRTRLEASRQAAQPAAGH